MVIRKNNAVYFPLKLNKYKKCKANYRRLEMQKGFVSLTRNNSPGDGNYVLSRRWYSLA